MSLRASYASMMLDKYRSGETFGGMKEDEFLQYLAKIMNTSSEQLREMYISASEGTFQACANILAGIIDENSEADDSNGLDLSWIASTPQWSNSSSVPLSCSLRYQNKVIFVSFLPRICTKLLFAVTAKSGKQWILSVAMHKTSQERNRQAQPNTSSLLTNTQEESLYLFDMYISLK